MNLLIDIGNSRCKYARCDGGAVTLCDAVDVERLDDLRASFQRHVAQTPEAVHVASVARDAHEACVAGLLRDVFGVDAVFVRVHRRDCGITTLYGENELGVDRFLGLAAAWRRLQRSCISVDCGTAVTADYLDRNGVHRGGVIAPGPATMRAGLQHRAARLAVIPQSAAAGVFATGTGAAVTAGCQRMLLAGIESIVREMRAQGDADAPLLFTGGAGAEAARACGGDFVPGLVLEGLSLVKNTN